MTLRGRVGRWHGGQLVLALIGVLAGGAALLGLSIASFAWGAKVLAEDLSAVAVHDARAEVDGVISTMSKYSPDNPFVSAQATYTKVQKLRGVGASDAEIRSFLSEKYAIDDSQSAALVRWGTMYDTTAVRPSPVLQAAGRLVGSILSWGLLAAALVTPLCCFWIAWTWFGARQHPSVG